MTRSSPLRSLFDRHSPVRPNSKILRRGAIGSLRQLDGRSAQGRLVRRLEGELLAHIGHEPSIAERLLVDQIVKLRLLLDALGERMMDGTFSDLDRRCFGAAHNAIRLALREIGLKPTAQAWWARPRRPRPRRVRMCGGRPAKNGPRNLSGGPRRLELREGYFDFVRRS